jgi:hypothetical protein
MKEKKEFGLHGNESDVEIIKSVADLYSSMGGTEDNRPINQIASQLTEKNKRDLKNKKLKKIVFEITDGAPDNDDLTKQAIAKLAEEGVLMVGFQIGNVSENERSKFEGIWNSGLNKNVKGIYIGKDIDLLPKKLMDELSSALSNIVI